MIQKIVAAGDLAKHPPHASFRFIDGHGRSRESNGAGNVLPRISRMYADYEARKVRSQRFANHNDPWMSNFSLKSQISNLKSQSAIAFRLSMHSDSIQPFRIVSPIRVHPRNPRQSSFESHAAQSRNRNGSCIITALPAAGGGRIDASGYGLGRGWRRQRSSPRARVGDARQGASRWRRWPWRGRAAVGAAWSVGSAGPE